MSGAVLTLTTSTSGFIATASPTILIGSKIGIGVVYTGGPSAVTIQGGQAPFSYVWTYVSGSTDVLPQTGGTYSTRFYANFTSVGARDAVYKCVVTDANSVVVDSNTVTINLSSE